MVVVPWTAAGSCRGSKLVGMASTAKNEARTFNTRKATREFKENMMKRAMVFDTRTMKEEEKKLS